MTTSRDKIQAAFTAAYNDLLKSNAMDLPDPIAELPGQEFARRALSVAAVSKRPLILISGPGNGADLLAAAGSVLGVPVLTTTPCPCGNLADPRLACKCSVGSIKKHQAKYRAQLPAAAMWLTLHPIPQSEIAAHRSSKYRGTSLDSIKDRVSRCAPRPSPALDKTSEQIMKQAATELGLSLDLQNYSIEVARDIAALDGAARIGCEHLCEAIQYRQPQI